MKKYLLILSIFLSASSYAQIPDDALRTAWFIQNGTGRNTATGGVMGSLGGDITANHVNPAGLGLFKTNEFVLSPGFLFNNNKLNYRGTDTGVKKNNFNYGASGIIFGGSTNRNRKWTSSAFAISVNQVASYNNHIQFNGYNNMSSFSEKYLEELTHDRADTNAALSNYIFGSSLAFRTYLIDTIRGAGGSVAGFQSFVPISTGVLQSYDATTSGGYHEVALGIAGNLEDKMYVGGSLVIPIINYQRDLVYSEKDATNNTNNQFASFEYRESYISRAVGVGLKLGMIYKPSEFLRFGVAFHTPQILGYRDEIRSSMTTNTESYAGIKKESSDNLNSGNPGQSEYNLTTPWRAIASISYVIREISDTRKQRGFLSADLEYVNYRSARYSGVNNASEALINYYRLVNNEIKDYYKGNLNFRIGGELKFNVWMIRLGGGYYGSPYADKNLNADRIVASGGLGYRNHGMFVDLSYAHAFQKDVQFAYRLNDKPNTFASQTGGRGNLMLTLGFKF
ncbi:MAG: outer membrane protein transport protein [Chitinophagaceae bacterium]|nr:outer membrane protein transport protein [Chitinophagaceae bacterium]